MPTPKIMSAAVVDKFRESLVIRELTVPTLGGSEAIIRGAAARIDQ